MALQFPQGFSRNYAAARAAQPPSMERQMYDLLNPPVEQTFKQDYANSIDDNMESILKGWGQDISNWATLDFTNIKDPATAFMEFKNSIEKEGGEKLRYAKKNNLLDPIAYLNAYKQRMGAIAPALADKLYQHQIKNNLNPDDMQELIAQHPGLDEILRQYTPAMLADGQTPNPAYANLLSPPKKGFGQEWGEALSGIPEWTVDRLRPGNLPWTVGIGTGAGWAARKGLKSPTGKKLLAGSKDYAKKASELFKDKATSAKNLATNNKGVAGMKNLTSKVLDKIEKHGAAKVAKYITKKLGWKIAARTLAKGALGLAGLATGGLATAAMAAWSAKDLYDVANAVSEMD